MSNWLGRDRFPAGPSGDKPRFKPMMLAIPLGVFLVFSTVTGHVNLTSAFDTDPAKIDRFKEQKAALEATAQAELSQAQAPVNLPLEPASPTEVASPTTDSTPFAGGLCEPSDADFYCLYTVQEGDSLAAIAERFGLQGGDVPAWELIFESNKADLAGLEAILEPGWTLRVPTSNGIVHLVLPGDSLSVLARDYDVSMAGIAEANGLSDMDDVQIGSLLLIPEPGIAPGVAPLVIETEEDDSALADQGELVEVTSTDEVLEDTEETEIVDETAEESTEEVVEPTAEPEDTAEPQETPEPEATPEPAPVENLFDAATDNVEENPDASTEGEGSEDSDDTQDGEEREEPREEPTPEPTPEPTVEPAPEPAPQAAAAVDDPTRMSWPVVQPLAITNYMTARHPLGMDFGLGANPTSNIMAAAGGTVTFAGGDPCCSYGYYVIVDHGNGLQTLYAHFSRIGVSKGQRVERGQSLGIAGDTGNSRGVHLHFEVYKNGTRVDPMNYLPR